MRAKFSKYPKRWDLERTDRSIDHGQVPNLIIDFKRHHNALNLPNLDDYSRLLPGDLITCTISPNLPHIMIVSDKNEQGRPYMIHHIGSGTQEEDRLADFPLTDHFRWKHSLVQPLKPSQLITILVTPMTRIARVPKKQTMSRP